MALADLADAKQRASASIVERQSALNDSLAIAASDSLQSKSYVSLYTQGLVPRLAYLQSQIEAQKSRSDVESKKAELTLEKADAVAKIAMSQAQLQRARAELERARGAVNASYGLVSNHGEQFTLASVNSYPQLGNLTIGRKPLGELDLLDAIKGAIGAVSTISAGILLIVLPWRGFSG